MNCVDEVNDLFNKAQNDIIARTGSYDSWDNRLIKAIYQCPALGNEQDRNDLARQVRSHLEKVGLEAGWPKVVSIDELKNREIPPPIEWPPK